MNMTNRITNRELSGKMIRTFIIAGLLCLLLFTAHKKPDSTIILHIRDATNNNLRSGVQLEWMSGYDNSDGESLYQAVTEHGAAVQTIPFGEYTLKWSLEGYYEGSCNFTVKENEISLDKYLIPCIEGDFSYILAEWNGEMDIDLCVYSEENGRCIGREALLPEKGSFSYGDNDRGYELVRLDGMEGNYSVYLKDCDAVLGEYWSEIPAEEMTVSLYTGGGQIYQIKAEADGAVGLWNSFDLCDGRVEERDEYICDMTGHAWAARDKNAPLSWTADALVREKEKYRFARQSGELYRIVKYEYDRAGNQIAYTEYMQYEDGEGDDTAFYHYNEYGKSGGIIEHATFRPVQKYEAEYNEHGDLTAERYYIPFGSLDCEYRNEYLYDRNGRVVACERYQVENANYPENCGLYEEEKYEYKYDADERMNGYVRYHYGSDGLLYDEYIYDENERLVTYNHYHTDGISHSTEEYQYDENGNLTREDYYVDDLLIIHKRYGYDANGIRRVCYSYVRGRMDYIQEYDELGNLSAEYDRDAEMKNWYEYLYDANAGMLTIYYYTGNKSDGILDSKTVIIYV